MKKASNQEYIEIGNRLRAVRERFGFKQDKMAKTLGVGRIAYSRNETGMYLPSIHTFIRLNNLLGVSIEWALFNHGAMLLKDQEKSTEAKQTHDPVSLEIDEMTAQMKNIPLLRYFILERFNEFKIDHKDLFVIKGSSLESH